MNNIKWISVIILIFILILFVIAFRSNTSKQVTHLHTVNNIYINHTELIHQKNDIGEINGNGNVVGNKAIVENQNA